MPSEQSSRASYIQTIPIPWTWNSPTKTSAAVTTKSNVDSPALHDAVASPAKMPSPAPSQPSDQSPNQRPSQAPGKSPEHDAAVRTPVTTQDAGSSAQQTIRATTARAPAPPVQLSEPLWTSRSLRPEPQVRSLPPVAAPIIEFAPIRMRNPERWPTVEEHVQAPAVAKVQPLPPVAAHEPWVPKGILQSSGILESGRAPHADPVAQPAEPMPAYGIAQPKFVIHADAVSQPGEIEPAYGIAQPKAVVRADAISESRESVPAYGKIQPSGVVHADGVSQSPGEIVPAYGIAAPEHVVRAGGGWPIASEPNKETSRPNSASQSTIAVRQQPPAGILQSFPPVSSEKEPATSDGLQSFPPIGKIQNLPPFSPVRADATPAAATAHHSNSPKAELSTKTEPSPSTETKSLPAESKMQTLPPISGLQSFPPMSYSQPATPAKPSSPGSETQSSLPSGAIQSLPSIGGLQSFPPL
jgi:hypothetical protein